MRKRLTTEEFIRRAKSVHGDKYDYSKSACIAATEKLIINCRQHGDFHQVADSHLHRHGCPKCAIETNSIKRKEKTRRSRIELTSDVLKSRLSYSESTGIFRWKSSEEVAGTVNASGYIMITIMGKSYRAHRLAWLYTHGRWPNEQIDHINNIRDDNRIVNLREATHGENMKNMTMSKANTSGVKGVSWCKVMKKWFAYVGNSNQRIKVGYFNDIESAEIAVKKTREKLHYEFHNHGLGEEK